MAASSGQQLLQIYSQWFAFADEDRDGCIGGAEAVRFFGRSGLDQQILGQIWELASSGAPTLNQTQFSNALRLVALAQVGWEPGGGEGWSCKPDAPHGTAQGSTGAANHAHPLQSLGGRLPLDQARITLAGMGPALPIPRMYGMKQFGATSYSPQVTGTQQPVAAAAAGYTPQGSGPAPPTAAAANFAAAGYIPQFTGTGAWSCSCVVAVCIHKLDTN